MIIQAPKFVIFSLVRSYSKCLLINMGLSTKQTRRLKVQEPLALKLESSESHWTSQYIGATGTIQREARVTGHRKREVPGSSRAPGEKR